MQHVHVRINDAATGKPTPCRVCFTDAAGNYYAPFGRLTEFATGNGVDVGGNLQCRQPGERGKPSLVIFAYVDGSFEIELPPGQINVEISKGPEYTPFCQQIDLTPGKLALRFTIERWTDLRKQGWYSGDARCHALTPHAAILEGAAEDLAVVNLLARVSRVQDWDGWGDTRTERIAHENILTFSGQQECLRRDEGDCMVVVNSLNMHPRLGSLGLLNCHRVVYPLSFGPPPFGDGFDSWTLADWCDQCHRKKGLVVWTDTEMPGQESEFGERLADALLGKVDALEANFGWSDRLERWLNLWYGLLNCGIKTPIVGASGKESNNTPLGCLRTYAHVRQGHDFSYSSWIEAIRIGTTFVTNAPLLFLSVADRLPGETVSVRRNERLHIKAVARSLVPIERLELVVNGVPTMHVSASGHPASAVIETEITAENGGWIAARCFGRHWLPGPFEAAQRAYAHTSPVFLTVEGRPASVDRTQMQRFLNQLNQMLKWVDHKGHFANDAQRQRLRKVFEDALQVLQKASPH